MREMSVTEQAAALARHLEAMGAPMCNFGCSATKRLQFRLETLLRPVGGVRA
jgi:hypothetical protein